MRPQTRYAKAGDVHIAYQVFGNGPLDVVFVPGMISHVDYWWEEPRAARFFRRLASFARVILFDKRGLGASDRSSEWAPIEERMDDLLAVLHAAASPRPAVIGVSEGGPMSLLFAATHPGHCRALCVVGGFARLVRSEDYPYGYPAHVILSAYERFVERWGEPATIEVLAPSISGDPEERARWARFERLGSNPAAVRAVGRMISQIDLRPVLAQVRVPTLILHASRDVAVPPGTGRYLAEHIAGAKYVEYDTPDHVFWIHPDPIADAIQEFLTGTPVEPEPDRVLAAVAFIDVARSTERAAQLGDAAWVQLLERYRALARRELSRFGGQQLDEAGDGILAAFDGPARAVRWAAATRDAVRALGIEVRAGVHVGECERVGAKLGGIAVHIGARVAELAAPGEVIVSGTVVDLIVGSGLRFEERGTRALRGVPGEWRLLALRDRD
jgi:pimeloyl-ACP methyl ester carboxylesterase